MKTLPVAFGLLLVLNTMLAWADEDAGSEFTKEIEYRQSVMTIYSWNLKQMGAMLKGKVPFDAAVFRARAGDLAKATQLELLLGFPEDSDEGETDARADIWLDFEDFEQKYQNLQSEGELLNKAASGEDQAQLKAAFGDVGEACKACHKAYKN